MRGWLKALRAPIGKAKAIVARTLKPGRQGRHGPSSQRGVAEVGGIGLRAQALASTLEARHPPGLPGVRATGSPSRPAPSVVNTTSIPKRRPPIGLVASRMPGWTVLRGFAHFLNRNVGLSLLNTYLGADVSSAVWRWRGRGSPVGPDEAQVAGAWGSVPAATMSSSGAIPQSYAEGQPQASMSVSMAVQGSTQSQAPVSSPWVGQLGPVPRVPGARRLGSPTYPAGRRLAGNRKGWVDDGGLGRPDRGLRLSVAGLGSGPLAIDGPEKPESAAWPAHRPGMNGTGLSMNRATSFHWASIGVSPLDHPMVSNVSLRVAQGSGPPQCRAMNAPLNRHSEGVPAVKDDRRISSSVVGRGHDPGIPRPSGLGMTGRLGSLVFIGSAPRPVKPAMKSTWVGSIAFGSPLPWPIKGETRPKNSDWPPASSALPVPCWHAEGALRFARWPSPRPENLVAGPGKGHGDEIHRPDASGLRMTGDPRRFTPQVPQLDRYHWAPGLAGLGARVEAGGEVQAYRAPGASDSSGLAALRAHEQRPAPAQHKQGFAGDHAWMRSSHSGATQPRTLMGEGLAWVDLGTRARADGGRWGTLAISFPEKPAVADPRAEPRTAAHTLQGFAMQDDRLEGRMPGPPWPRTLARQASGWSGLGSQANAVGAPQIAALRSDGTSPAGAQDRQSQAVKSAWMIATLRKALSAGPRPARVAEGAGRVSRGPVHRLTRSLGEPLPVGMRPLMESIFRADFSRVRLHRGPDAGRAASALSADAFTVGQHVFFAPGKLDWHRPRGLALLGHELAHVVQRGQQAFSHHAPSQPEPAGRSPLSPQPGSRASAQTSLFPADWGLAFEGLARNEESERVATDVEHTLYLNFARGIPPGHGPGFNGGSTRVRPEEPAHSPSRPRQDALSPALALRAEAARPPPPGAAVPTAGGAAAEGYSQMREQQVRAWVEKSMRELEEPLWRRMYERLKDRLVLEAERQAR